LPIVGNSDIQKPCTFVTEHYEVMIGDSKVTFVDTPGLLDPGHSQTEILTAIADYLRKMKMVPNCIIYVSKFTDNVTNSADIDVARDYLNYFGQEFPLLKDARNVLTVLTYAGPDISNLPGAVMLARNASDDEKREVWIKHCEVREKQVRENFVGCKIVAIDNRPDFYELLNGSFWFDDLLRAFALLSYQQNALLLQVIRAKKEMLSLKAGCSKLEKEEVERDLKSVTTQENYLMASLLGVGAGVSAMVGIAAAGAEIALVGGAADLIMFTSAWEFVGVAAAATEVVTAATLVSTAALATATGAVAFVAVAGLGYFILKKFQ